MPQKVTQVDTDGNVIDRSNSLDVGGKELELIRCALEEMLEHMKLQTELLKDLAK